MEELDYDKTLEPDPINYCEKHDLVYDLNCPGCYGEHDDFLIDMYIEDR